MRENFPISIERMVFIDQHFNEMYFGEGDDEIQKIFKTLTSHEIHYALTGYNWDAGLDFIEWIIDSPLCDKGTALMVYWLMNPAYHKSESDEEFLLFKKVEKKLLNNEFTHKKIAFDPKNDNSANLVKEESTEKGVSKIPDELKEKTEGESWPYKLFREKGMSAEYTKLWKDFWK